MNEDCRKDFEEAWRETPYTSKRLKKAALDLWLTCWITRPTRRPTGQVDFEKVVREWALGNSVIMSMEDVSDLITRLKTAVPAESVEPWKEIDRLCSELKYIAGIVERGKGIALALDTSVSTAILDYVKELEATKAPAESVNAELVRALQPFADAFSKYGEWRYSDHEDREKWFAFQDSNQVLPSNDLVMGDFRRAHESLNKAKATTTPTVKREVVDTGQSILKSWADDNDEFMHGTIWDDLAGRINRALKEAHHV